MGSYGIDGPFTSMIYVLKRVILNSHVKLQEGSIGSMNHGQNCGHWPLKSSYMIYTSGYLMNFRSVHNLRSVHSCLQLCNGGEEWFNHGEVQKWPLNTCE